MATYYYTRLLAAATLLLFTPFLMAQSGCPNADFSQSNFNLWTGYTGNYNNPGQTPGIVPGRHTVITTQAVDPFTCGGLNMIPPGETTSCRLGNSNTGSQAEQLRYQLTVGTDNALFVYKYAVVLENPSGHLPSEQPEFSVRILNQGGTQIGGSCGIYTVYGGQPGQNFQDCGGVTWLPWTIVGMDLSPFMGQTVVIEFQTKDCSLSGHFGYAYVSAECMPLLLDVAYCEGANNVTITAPPGFQDYLWSPGGQTTESISINNPVIGSVYSCTLTTFSNQGNCTVTLNAQVVPTSVHAGFTFSPACANVPIQFTDTTSVVNGTANGWQWDFGDGQTSTSQHPVHTFTSSGNFNVQLITSSSEGCSDTIVQTLGIYPLPTVQFALSNECINETVQFDNQSSDPLPLVYSWSFGDGSPLSAAEDPSHIYTTDGQYTVTLTAENGNGCVDSLQQTMTIWPLPAIDAGADVQVCPNTPVTLSGSGGTSYVWDNNVTDGVAFTPTATATYTVTGTDINGCQNTDDLLLTFFAPPVVDAGPDVEVCTGTAVVFQGSGAASYSWTGGITDGQSFVPAIGTYTFTVTGTDANGCEDTDYADLIVNPNPVVDAGPDQTICFGASTVLAGSGAATCAWDNGGIDGQPFSPPATNTYTVTGTSSDGCTGTDQAVVAVEPPANVVFSAPVTNGCEPLTVNLTNNSTGTPGVSCYWDFGDGYSASGCGSVQHQYTEPGCYDVELIVTTALGCVWNTVLSDYICVYPNPVASFVPVPGTITELDPVATMSNSSTGAVTYAWIFDDGSAASSEEHPEHTFPTEPVTNYLVHLTAISDHGCIDTVSHLVMMDEVLIYYIPNAFTPDDDVFNQTFRPVFTSGHDPFDFNMQIYNRWGEIVFETNNDRIGWDGTYHGEVVKEGTYTWRIEFKTTTSDERKFVTGHVNVLR
jgi:gliding motility-associated-like protein